MARRRSKSSSNRFPGQKHAGRGGGNPDEGPRKNKALGQHFLRAESDADRVADGLRAWSKDRTVLEVGPGAGALTRALLARWKTDAPPLWCCEKDTRFADALVHRFPVLQDRILRADFLRLELAQLPEGPFALVGNFPYNISSQIVFRVLEWRDRVPLMVGMFQKEVAERICAEPGTKARGVLSVLCEAYYEREWLFDLPPEAFEPPPKVHSSVIRLRRKADPQPELPPYRSLARLVKAGFAMRRKKMRNGLKGWRWKAVDPPSQAPGAGPRAEPGDYHAAAGVTIPEADRQRLELLLDQRAEQLQLEDFCFLAQTLEPIA